MITPLRFLKYSITSSVLKYFTFIYFFTAFIFFANAADTPKTIDNSKTVSLNEENPLTLKDCYNLALKQSELIAIDVERIKETQAHFLQAFGTLLPQVSFARVETRQTSDTVSVSNNSFEQKFVFKQALFSGFKEFAGISGSRFEKNQRENEKLRSEQLLFVDVCDAFYLLIEQREDLKVLDIVKKAFLDRIGELKNREDIGKSRTSEIVSTETQLYNLEAEIESVKSRELVARELLEFLIGRSANEIIDSDTNFSLKPESEYVSKAASRADVQAANLAWKVSQKQIAIAKSGFFPTVSLEGDYFTHRTSTPSDSRWTGLLTFNVPIFEGTTTYGKVKEAIAKTRENELLFTRAGRAAFQDIHDAYINAQAAFLRVNALEKALKSAELNYTLQLQDYQSNLVNNLDVLTALQNLEDIRRNFLRTSYDSKRFYRQLQVAAGEIQ